MAETPTQTLRVLYSCPLCGLTAVPVDVPLRGDDEDVLVWMEQTIRLTGEDHARRSPDCHPEQLHDLQIPIAGTERIGGPQVH